MVHSLDSEAPVVAVFGATGKQGGSVVKHLKESSRPYQIRAVVRDEAKAKDLGVELVKGDLDDPASLKTALSGAQIVFGVTNFWTTFTREGETKQGKAIVDAAKAANVKLLVWSGLPSPDQISHGKYKNILHFESKADVTAYAVEQLGEQRVVSVEPASYFPNYTAGNGLAPRPSPAGDGSYVLSQPGPIDGKWAIIDIDEYGLFVVAAIEKRDQIKGHRLYAATEELSQQEFIDIYRQYSNGKKVEYVELSPEQFQSNLIEYAKMAEPIAVDFTEMIGYTLRLGYYGKTTLDHSLLSRKPTSFRDWAAKQDWDKTFA